MNQRVIKQQLEYGSMQTNKDYKSGQVLVMLLVFIIIGITITSATVILSVINAKSSTKFQIGQDALSIAHSGAENAMMRLIRDPNYSGETLNIGDGTATITVHGTNPKIIDSVGTNGNFTRTVEVTATGSGFLTVSTWKEIQ